MLIRAMARLARIVAPGRPHHVTQRGSRKMEVFFTEEDRQVYLGLLHKYAARIVSCQVVQKLWGRLRRR
jgi:hypothetical protein